jgi:KDO2-lipid IV(A) lauroyltransferase
MRFKKVRQIFEYLGCKLGFLVLPKISYPILVRISQIAGWIAFHLASAERRVALANLDVVFGDKKTSKAKEILARKSFQSFARTTLEALAAARLEEQRLERHFVFTPGSLDLLQHLVERKKGLIALTFHYGNWEWLSLAWGMAGFPIKGVAQPIKNPRVDELFRIRREQAGHRFIHRRHAARHLYRSLKRKEIIGLLADLNTSPTEGGALYDFFGLPALTSRIVGFLALKTGAPIVCSVAYPRPDGLYQIEIGPEITYDIQGPEETESDRINRCWLAHAEAMILKRPELWMWSYKRWKVRPSPDQGRYPFYSFFDSNMIALAPFHRTVAASIEKDKEDLKEDLSDRT